MSVAIDSVARVFWLSRSSAWSISASTRALPRNPAVVAAGASTISSRVTMIMSQTM